MKRGFTLIELLVVVLIIGILAAVALPQYQRAVGKARAAEAKTVLSSYLRALRIAHLETGKNQPSNSELSIDLPSSQYWDFYVDECLMGNSSWGCTVAAAGKNQMQGVNIRLVDEGYTQADPNHTPSGFCCFEDEENKCKNMGFTKYNEYWETYLEP